MAQWPRSLLSVQDAMHSTPSTAKRKNIRARIVHVGSHSLGFCLGSCCGCVWILSLKHAGEGAGSESRVRVPGKGKERKKPEL